MTPNSNLGGWAAVGTLLQLSIVVVLLLTAWGVMPTHTQPIPDDALPAAGTPELGRLVASGRRIAMVECVNCHTANGGRPFAGGVPLRTLLGHVHSTNISPHPQAGIGRYTLDEFDRAVRHGIAREGWTLDPAMPYLDYARFSDTETKALYAYFMHDVEAAPDVDRPAEIGWPLSMRWPLALWRKVTVLLRDSPTAETD